MKKNYRKIALEPEMALNEVVLVLMGHAAKGEFVCVEFEGHKFYSDTISMNSAYQKVYGKTYYEMMENNDENATEGISESETAAPAKVLEEVKEEDIFVPMAFDMADTTNVSEEVLVKTDVQTVADKTADAMERMEEVEKSIAIEALNKALEDSEEAQEVEPEPEIPLSELELNGRARINQKYWDAWARCVKLFEGDEAKEKDLDICLSIIAAIDENDLQLNDAMKVVKNLDVTKERLHEILDVLEHFGDKGYYISKKVRASKGFRRATISGEENYTIYIDRDTRCQYLWVKNGSAGGLQLIVNADGTPKLYEGDVD